MAEPHPLTNRSVKRNGKTVPAPITRFTVANAPSTLYCKRAKNKGPALCRGRHFQDAIIVLFLRWYPRDSLSYRDLEEMMAERGLSLDHSPIARWVLRYATILSQRIRCEMRRHNRSWRVDETHVV
jgi:hypothetical protein